MKVTVFDCALKLAVPLTPLLTPVMVRASPSGSVSLASNADAGIVIVEYNDDARGTMEETADGGGHFTEVVLRPTVTTTTELDAARMDELHERAHALCYIASSVNFPVRCEARLRYRSSPR